MPLDSAEPSKNQKINFDDDDAFEADWLRRHDPANRPDFGDEKLGRELGLFFGGAGDAAKTAFKKENLPSTIAEAGLSAAAGVAIKLAETRLPGLRPASAILGTALATSFAADLSLNLKEVGGIMADTWNHRDHYQANREAFARHGGRFGFDLALTLTGGLSGALAAEKTLLTRANGYMRLPIFEEGGSYGELRGARRKLFSTSDARAEAFNLAEPSALRLSVRKTKAGFGLGSDYSSSTRGNGFVLSDDGLAVTNNHVVAGAGSIHAVDNRGLEFKASVLAADSEKDVAILHLHTRNPATRFSPAALAENGSQKGDRLFMLGHTRDADSLALSEGHMAGETQFNPALKNRPPLKAARWKADKEPGPDQSFVMAKGPSDLGTYYSKPGLSGSAVWNDEGQVVGIHTGRIKGYKRATFAPVEDITNLMQQALEARARLLKPQS